MPDDLGIPNTASNSMNMLTELAVEVKIPVNDVFIGLSVPLDYFKSELKTGN
jgi:hypothetical protein